MKAEPQKFDVYCTAADCAEEAVVVYDRKHATPPGWTFDTVVGWRCPAHIPDGFPKPATTTPEGAEEETK